LFDVDGIHPNIKASKGTPLDLHRIWLYLQKERGAVFGPWKGPPPPK
jgi:hypothetical protein